MKGALTIILYVLFMPLAFGQSAVNKLLVKLDDAISNESNYTQPKETHLKKLKEQLRDPNITKVKLYHIYKSLAKEYETFICDSAIAYSDKALALAINVKNNNWVNDSQIQLARCEAKAGMFNNAIHRLDNINRGALNRLQLIPYYATYIDGYIYWIEYQDGYDLADLIAKKKVYQDSLLRIVAPDTYEYATKQGFRYIEEGELDSAEAILTAYQPRVKPGTKESAGIASILSFMYQHKGNYEKQKEQLIISALSDVKACVKENISLRALALLLFEERDVKRANLYIKKSLDDANFYHARLRNIQSSKLLPIIDKVYQTERERQQNKLRILLLVVSVLSVGLIAGIVFIFRQMKALERAQKEILLINERLNKLNADLQAANVQQEQTNIHLAEANLIKEKFISHFLEISTEHIDKLDAFKLMVNRKLKAGQINDILKLTTTAQDVARELKTLYANFDKAFLSIYPDFITQLNNLLKPDERYPVGDGTALNQELRVFALIRLGIADSNKIATFLHYSLRTIYNYRSKVKSKAIDPDTDFEEKVRQIGLLR